jgi:hypothetical protein
MGGSFWLDAGSRRCDESGIEVPGRYRSLRTEKVVEEGLSRWKSITTIPLLIYMTFMFQ